MKKALTAASILIMLATPMVGYSQPMAAKPQIPPVAPSLVREGDLAVKLAGVLNLGAPTNETEAESILAGVGIAPRNGWISDYPVTPDIIIEVQKAIGDAADGNRLPMGKEEALKAFRTAAVEMEAPLVAEGPSGYAEGPPPTTPPYAEPSVINDYYYAEGPPVFTYYPPPWDYSYLYAWVPFPFYWTGFFFPGFFILNDFHRCFYAHGHPFVVSNHFYDHHHYSTVDPVNRSRGSQASLRTAGARPEGRGLMTAQGRKGAESILQRGHQQMVASRGPAGRSIGATRGPGAASFNGRPGGFSRSYAGGFHGGSSSFSRGFSGGVRGGGSSRAGSLGGLHGSGFGRGGSGHGSGSRGHR